ncbi:MAG: RNA polymerase factor sigma-54 [bacterium]
MPAFRFEQIASQRQTQQQKQRLIVSQKHQQAIKLLQQPLQDVAQWLTKQMQENPLLEMKENVETDSAAEVEIEEPPADEVNWDELLNRGEDYYYFRHRQSDYSDYSPEKQFRSMAEQSESLQDALRWQVQLLELPDRKLEQAEYLISCIDEEGYMDVDLEEFARENNISDQEAQQILKTVQELDPPGVGGRSLEEVILLQLADMEIDLPEKTEKIIGEHLEELQKRSFKKIASEVGTSPADVQEVADIVHQLEPRPGRVYEQANRQYIYPDIVVRELDGEFAVVLNDNELPPLRINSRYRAMLESDDPKLQEYVKEKLSGALWVLNCIYQRQQTMYKVVESIVEHQKDFFKKGVRGLKPLILKDIANDIGMHESTVSRAVRNKFVQTRRGLYSLKFFFSPALKTRDGGEVATTVVKSLLTEIVENEDKSAPLSDREIMEKLESEGIKIGRRTVSKYRKELEIPSWDLRRRVAE